MVKKFAPKRCKFFLKKSPFVKGNKHAQVISILLKQMLTQTVFLFVFVCFKKFQYYAPNSSFVKGREKLVE